MACGRGGPQACGSSFPQQVPVLNYLGYTWVDQNQNLKTAMEYIRKAVKLKPDDGYYIDSLGWAYYRLGNIQSAVEQLEPRRRLQARRSGHQ